MMLEWDNRIREEYAQELRETMSDVYGGSNTLLNSIQEFYGVKSISFKKDNIAVLAYYDGEDQL